MDRAADHLRAARVLRELGEPDPERIALHLARSAPVGDAQAVEERRAAAAQAGRRGAPAAAVAHLERALPSRRPPSSARPWRSSWASGSWPRAATRAPRRGWVAAIQDRRRPTEVVVAAAFSKLATGSYQAVVDALLDAATAREATDPDGALRLRGEVE